MIKKCVLRSFAMLMGLLGLSSIISVLIKLWQMVYEKDTLYPLSLASMFFCILLGGYSMIISVHVWKKMTSKVARQISLVITLFIVGILWSFMLKLQPHNYGYPEHTWMVLMLSLVVVVGGGLYCICSIAIIRGLSLADKIILSRREKKFKYYLSFLSVLLWSSLSLVFSSMDNNYDYIATVGSLLFALFFYKVSMFVFEWYNRRLCLDQGELKVSRAN